jgi:hypothetical protein
MVTPAKGASLLYGAPLASSSLPPATVGGFDHWTALDIVLLRFCPFLARLPPHHPLLILKVLFPSFPPNPSLAAAQCRPVFGASSRLRWTVGTVSISSTLPRRQRSLVCYGRTFAPFGSCLATITIKDPAQATSTGLCRITPGDPALLLRVIQPLLVLTGLAAVLGQNFCCLLGLFGSLFTLPSTLSSPSSLLLSSLPPSVGPCRP